MRKIYLLILLFIAIVSNAQLQGQAKIDSLLVELPKMKEDTLKVNALNELGFEHKFIDKDLLFKYTRLALILAKKINFKDGIFTSHQNLGIYYSIISDYQKATSNYSFIINNSKNNVFKSKAYSGLGIIFSKQSNFPDAYKCYLKSLTFAEKSNDKKMQAKILLNIGVAFFNLKQPEKAIFYLKKGLEINKKINSEIDDNIRMFNIALCYYDLKKLDSCLIYNQKAIDLDLKINDKMSTGACLGLIGQVYLDKKEYDKSIFYFNKQLIANTEIGQPSNMANNIANIGFANLQKYKTVNKTVNKNEFLLLAISNYKKSLLINKQINYKENISSDYFNLSDAYKLQGNYKEALESHEQYAIYKDSVFNADNKETIKNLEDKREIELRDNQIKINKLSLEAKEKQKWYLFAGLGLLTVIGGLLFYQSQKRKQVNQKLELLNQNLDAKNLELDQANKAKTRFFGILNHDLRGPVANLVFFLQLQQESPEMLDPESIKRMQDKTMTGAENLLSTMEDILQWSKSQMENFKPQPKNFPVKQLFDDTKKVFSGYLKISFEYQNEQNIEVFTDENYLKTIIRNLTSNAINVFTNTENPKIIWKAWQEENKSYFSIQDNGPGASQEQLKALFEDTEISSAKSGLGLYLIRDMAKAINCEISVDSKIGFGTTFTLKL